MIDLASDVSPEELQVFLQDTDEQLQRLDEDIIKLESDGDNETLLNGIFRAAHTIKGSSAMLGYQKMADLTHAMENILDKLRKGTLSVTTQTTDALLHSLDVLRILRAALTSAGGDDTDVSAVVAMLEELAGGKEGSSQTAGQDAAVATATSISLTEHERKRIRESLALGRKVYQIRVDIDKESTWAAARCFQVLADLEEKGTVIASNPSREDIEAEKVDSHLELIFAGLLEEDESREMLNSIPDIENVRVSCCDANPDEPPGSADTSGKTTSPEAIRASETVRIEVGRLDSLMNMIGEMVVARTRMNQIGKALESRYNDDQDVIDLAKTFTHVSKIVDGLQLDITAARMLPVGTVFNRFPRMIRDLAQKAGKKIDFTVTGEETGIDRSVIEHIRDPLVHLLRNAVDHGIELPGKREAAGKPERGTIRLSAAHEQNYIVITVEDDGKGIDGAVIKEAAIRKGIISPEAAARISDAEGIDLIFEAGMSTAEKATDVSGRGVGMDIVRRNVEALNGTIHVETRVGVGTKFRLKLPLTLATFQALLVSSNSNIYAIPLVSIVETLALESEEIDTVAQKEVIRLRDRIIPLLRLDTLLGVSTNGSGRSGKVHVVVVKSGERIMGLAVDSLNDPQEVMVKSLGSLIGEIKGISGASILGNGEVALILDVPSLVRFATMGKAEG